MPEARVVSPSYDPHGSKPKTVDEYVRWLDWVHHVRRTPGDEAYYDNLCITAKAKLESTSFWQQLVASLVTWEGDYGALHRGYGLLMERHPTLVTKPYASFIEKTFRANVVHNQNWPDAPPDGWTIPFGLPPRINDLVRTTVTVKYLDGVTFLLERFRLTGEGEHYENYSYFQARDDGYYAAHFYVEVPLGVLAYSPTPSLITVPITLEIQITTQLQEVIRRLLHTHYERSRTRGRDRSRVWQWEYDSEEFDANYLGHILHYVEGMIMGVRKGQETSEVRRGASSG